MRKRASPDLMSYVRGRLFLNMVPELAAHAHADVALFSIAVYLARKVPESGGNWSSHEGCLKQDGGFTEVLAVDKLIPI